MAFPIILNHCCLQAPCHHLQGQDVVGLPLVWDHDLREVMDRPRRDPVVALCFLFGACLFWYQFS